MTVAERQHHRVIAPRIFGELVGDRVGVYAPYRITNIASQIGQLWQIEDELFVVEDIHDAKDPITGNIPKDMAIMLRVTPADGYLPRIAVVGHFELG
jgi:hypothetical protein